MYSGAPAKRKTNRCRLNHRDARDGVPLHVRYTSRYTWVSAYILLLYDWEPVTLRDGVPLHVRYTCVELSGGFPGGWGGGVRRALQRGDRRVLHIRLGRTLLDPAALGWGKPASQPASPAQHSPAPHRAASKSLAQHGTAKPPGKQAGSQMGSQPAKPSSPHVPAPSTSPDPQHQPRAPSPKAYSKGGTGCAHLAGDAWTPLDNLLRLLTSLKPLTSLRPLSSLRPSGL